MQLQMEQLSPIPIVYMRRVGAYGPENYKLMASMKEWTANQGLNTPDSIIYGIAWDNAAVTPPEHCRYDVCLATGQRFPDNEPVEPGIISGGKYAVYLIAHTAQAVQEFWTSFLQVLEHQHLALDSSRPILERYPFGLVEQGQCEFCVPVL